MSFISISSGRAAHCPRALCRRPRRWSNRCASRVALLLMARSYLTSFAEVTQSCTVNVAGNMFDMDGGCTVVIDPQGEVRYSISKRFTSDARRARQHAAISGPLKEFWMKSGRRYKQKPGVLQHVHAS